MMLRAGSSTALITPPLGTKLAGYPGRPEGAGFVYDDLFIRSLVLESDGVPYALMSADLMGVEPEWVAELRRRAGEVLGIPAENILFATTHTHSATGGLFSYRSSIGKVFQASFDEIVDSFDEVLYELLLRQAVSGLKQALDNLRPASLRAAVGFAPGIASNRRDPARDADPSCFVLHAVDEDRHTVATLFHFACHPTVLGFQDVGISADFPGVACRILEQSLGQSSVALYLNGALGDISTRFTRRSQTYAEVERFGRILAGAVLAALGQASAVESTSMFAKEDTIQLRPKSEQWFREPEKRAAALRDELSRQRGVASHGELRQLSTALQGAETAGQLAQRLRATTSVAISLQRVQIAPGLDLVAVPAEMFSASARALEEKVPGRAVRLVGPANGYIGYVPSAEAYDEGAYEVDSALVDQGSAETVIERAVALLQDG